MGERAKFTTGDVAASGGNSSGVWRMWPARCLVNFKEGIQLESKGLTDTGLLSAHDPVA